MPELNPYTFTDNPTESGVATCDTDVLNDDIMYLKWELSNTPSANQDLSNLTADGNTKFQYAPFSINSGSVDASGSNITLYTPTEPVIIEESFVQPTLSANGTMGGSSFAVSASSQYSSDYAAWKAVDGSNSTFWQTAATTTGSFTFYNPTPLKVTSLYLSAYNTTGRQLKAGNIQGSNDNSTWTTITSWSGNTSLNLTVNMSSNTNYYNYYKINVTAVQANYAVSLRNLQITAVYQKTITVGTDLICNPCTITTADCRTKTFEGSASLDCSSVANGTYKVLKDFETGDLSVVSSLDIKKTAPTSPSSGDYWLDFSEIPSVMKVYDGTDWIVDNDKVYIGQVTIASSAISSVTNQYFNSCPYRRDLVESYKNGLSWYNIYSDGWCEQGGETAMGYYTSPTTVNLLKAYKNTNYNIIAVKEIASHASTGTVQVTRESASYFTIAWTYNSSRYALWRACGYIS